MIAGNAGAPGGGWGGEKVRLELPACTLELQGLSAAQQRRIALDYQAFLPGPGSVSGEPDVVCGAGRLHEPLTFPAEFFTVHGEYAPHLRRAGSQVEIVGYDSLGSLDRAGERPARATLAVAAEDLLPRAFVLENFLRIVVAYQALDRRGVLLHSVAVIHDEQVFLFCGRSNAGKTTLARKAAAAGGRVLSDDLNLAVPAEGQYWVRRVPFTGEFGRQDAKGDEGAAFPLGGLALLHKGETLSVCPIRPAEAMAGFLACCPFVNGDHEELAKLMSILADMVSHTPVLRVGAARESSFAAIMAAVKEVASRAH